MRFLTAAAILALLAGVLIPEPAEAHRYRHSPRVQLGFHFGAPAFWYPGPWYYPPYYYYPPVVAVPAQPTRYIERADAYNPPEQQQGYWYYCPEAKAYYPYVQQCPGGWQRVNPQPPQ